MNWKNSRPFISRITFKHALIYVAIALAIIYFVFSGSDPVPTPTSESLGQQEEATALAPDGSISLSKTQLKTQKIETDVVESARFYPVPGLSARAVQPLDASVEVTAPYAGVVTRILADAGQTVNPGQALIYIQSKDALAAQSDLARTTAEATVAKQQAQRDASLLGEGIISAARSQQSQAADKAAQSALALARGAVTSIKFIDNGQVGEYAVLSPMKGEVLRRIPTPGQSVAQLETLMTIAEPGKLDILFYAPVKLLGQIRPGIEVTLPEQGKAIVVAVGADADPSSQSLQARAQVKMATDTDKPALVPGQQFPVTLLLEAPTGALELPAKAVLPMGNGHVVFTAQPDAPNEGLRLHAVPVRLLGSDGNSSVIAAPTAEYSNRLTSGHQVVTQGTSVLKSLLPVH